MLAECRQFLQKFVLLGCVGVLAACAATPSPSPGVPPKALTTTVRDGCQNNPPPLTAPAAAPSDDPLATAVLDSARAGGVASYAPAPAAGPKTAAVNLSGKCPHMEGSP